MRTSRILGAAFLAAATILSVIAVNKDTQLAADKTKRKPSQPVRRTSASTLMDLRLNQPVDPGTIAIPAETLEHAIEISENIDSADAEALVKAIKAGEDITVLSVSSNGWVVKIGDMVETSDASVPGTLVLGGRIFGAPKSGDHILIDGSDFWYNRQIPGSTDPEAGLGNIVTDPYLDWRLGSFFFDWGETNKAMYAALMEINDLPATLGEELYEYQQATGQVAQAAQQIYDARDDALGTITGIRDEVVEAGDSITQQIEDALSRAEGGTSWTHSEVNSYTISVQDHQNITCPWYGSAEDTNYTGITIELPEGDGTKHCRVTFTNAGTMGYDAYNGNGNGVNFACDNPDASFMYYGESNDDVYSLYRYNDYYGETQYYNVIVFDMFEYDVNCWMVKRYFADQYYP